MRGVACAGAHLIVVEGNIHAPMQAILHRPMGAHRGRHPRRVRHQAADVQPLLVRRLASGRALGFDHRKGFQFRPLLRLRQAVQLIEDVTTAVRFPSSPPGNRTPDQDHVQKYLPIFLHPSRQYCPLCLRLFFMRSPWKGGSAASWLWWFMR